MTSQADWREAAARAIEAIRAAPVEPYREGAPARRVVRTEGRRTGRTRPFGVNVTRVGGRLYLCSSHRRRDWVRNVVAAGRCTVERDGPGGTDADYSAVLVEGREAAEVLATYLPQAGFQDPELPFAVDASVAEIIPHAATTAVFRLDPLGVPAGAGR
ncbi:nitroreductase/quinone reductase family protein [Spirillospora sp. CA-108201]